MCRSGSRVLPFVLAALVGCGGAPEPAPAPAAAPALARVLADTGTTLPLAVSPPAEVRAWVTAVTPARVPLVEPPLPAAEPDSVDIGAAPAPAAAPDDRLRPPIPIGAAPLAWPPGHARGGRAVSVDLEVRVDEDGAVRDVAWAGGSRDTALVRAALACARAMRFHPALRRGAPVAVWCRQRFEFGRR